jgi:hypothetical protein
VGGEILATSPQPPEHSSCNPLASEGKNSKTAPFTVFVCLFDLKGEGKAANVDLKFVFLCVGILVDNVTTFERYSHRYIVEFPTRDTLRRALLHSNTILLRHERSVNDLSVPEIGAELIRLGNPAPLKINSRKRLSKLLASIAHGVIIG